MVGGLGRSTFYEGYGLVVKPTKVTDAVSALSSEDNLALNTWRSASRLTLWGTESRLVADQAPDVAKRVSWVAGIDLDQVKAVGAAHNATVNDVLLGAVSLGLSAYLQERGREVPSETNFLVPIALKPIDMSLPKELGNHFAMVMFPMPLGITEVDALLGEVRSRMARIKNSAEAMMIFGVQRAVAETPQRISQNLTRFVANKSVGLLTNVPDPRAPIYLAGAQGRRHPRLGAHVLGPEHRSVHLQLQRPRQHRHRHRRRDHPRPRPPRGPHPGRVRRHGGRVLGRPVGSPAGNPEGARRYV